MDEKLKIKCQLIHQGGAVGEKTNDTTIKEEVDMNEQAQGACEE